MPFNYGNKELLRHIIHTLDFIFSRPIFNSKDFTGPGEEIPATTSKRILIILLKNEVLKIVRESSGRKPIDHKLLRLSLEKVDDGEKIVNHRHCRSCNSNY
jgi:hypothetical protein